MRSFRILAVLVMAVVCVSLSSCSKDYLDKSPEDEFNEETLYPGYIDSNDYECLGAMPSNEGKFLISGLKDKHLWFGVFEYGGSKTKLYEWIDPDATNKKQNHYIGYGDYKEFTLSNIYLTELKEIGNSGFIGRALLLFTAENDNRKKLMTVFRSSNQVNKRYSDWITPEKYNPIMEWYESSWIIDNCCYSSKGDTIFIPKIILSANDNPVSYKEGIHIDGQTITRINYEDNKIIWQSDLPFLVASNCRCAFTLQDSSTSNWRYKVDVTYYDGTKKDFSFTINIETGTIIGEELPISYASLEGRWDMTKCYGWEYNGDGVKEDWTEDVKGEYIFFFFESTHGNGGYFDGSKTNYFASSLDGNKLILKNSNWLLGKSITITKLTTTELHITATEASSVENYEMKKRYLPIY